MITERTLDKNKAQTLEEMQQIARNQIQAMVYQLEERVARLKNLLPQVESVVDWNSYDQIVADVRDYGDDASLTALKTLAEYYDMLSAGPGGGYF